MRKRGHHRTGEDGGQNRGWALVGTARLFADHATGRIGRHKLHEAVEFFDPEEVPAGSEESAPVRAYGHS